MLNEKIVYYRKKNMLTQEELAYQLNVSRQTVTKWETGTIYPNIEYLIKLSNLFGVSIDYLVKEDDCLTLETHKIEIGELACFLVKAKKATYANKTNKINSPEDLKNIKGFGDSIVSNIKKESGTAKEEVSKKENLPPKK